MRHSFALLGRLFVVLAIAVAMTGSSLAHRAAATETDDSLLAYVAAGGLLDDLCGQAGFGGAGNTGCDACRLVDSAAVPPGSAMVRLALDADAVLTVVHASEVPVQEVYDRSCPARAPPVV